VETTLDTQTAAGSSSLCLRSRPVEREAIEFERELRLDG
jgi:hypothetical protein